MSSTPITLPLSDVIEVTVSAAAAAVPPLPFNQGLIIGPSPVIPSYGANARIRQYANLGEMLLDGFSTSEPEYISASLYFGQATPPLFVWVGRQDLTAIFSAIPHSGNAGTGYAVGDSITPTQGGASNASLKVLTITGGGAVATLGVVAGQQGTGYSVATGLPTTTTGAGGGLEVDITAIGETPLQAVTAIELINQLWYGFMVTDATDSDHLALAAYSTANWQQSFYFGSSPDAAIPAGTSGNLALQMQALKYRTLLNYATTQGGEFPNNIYAAAAILGLAMGLNTGAANSAFVLNLKSLVGIAPEPLTQTQYQTVIGQNCNVCVTYGPYIGFFVNGKLPSGEFFDQILFRAMLINQIQTNLMNLLIAVPKIPQTDAGEHQLIAQVDSACANLANIGYIGPGVWNEAPVLNLQTGQSLPLGYLNQAPPYSTQSAGNRAARQSMPVYCCILEAGGVQSVQVNVFVEQ